MAAAHVQSTGNHAASAGTTIAATYGGAVGAGRLLVCRVVWSPGSTTCTVSDSVNGAWTAIGTPVNETNAGRLQMFYRANAGAGTPTVTATISNTVGYRNIAIGEWSGILTASPLDANNATTGTGTAPAVSLTTVTNHCLVVGGSGNAQTGAAGSGFNSRVVQDGNVLEDLLDKTPAGAVSVAFTQAPTGGWTAAGAAFKPSASAISKTLTPATEADAAQALVVRKPILKTLSPAAETDAAQALSVTKTIQKTLTPAGEASAGVSLSVTKRLSLMPATETDSAEGLSVGGPKSLDPATESDAAQTLSVAKRVTLVPAIELGTAVALAVTKRKTLTPATEADAAVARVVIKRVTLTPAAETDTARTLAFVKPIRKTLVPAAETDAARVLSISHPHRVTLVPATEADSALTLSVAGTVISPVALETARTAGFVTVGATTAAFESPARTASLERPGTTAGFERPSVAAAFEQAESEIVLG